MPEVQRQDAKEPEIAIAITLGYVWSALNTLVGLLLAVVFYRAHSFRWSDGCIEAVGGTFQRDGNITRIWGRPDAQTHGWLIIYATAEHRVKIPMRVHERVHVVQAMIGGPLFPIAYGAHFLFEFAREGFDSAHWRDAYLRIWAERTAYRIQDEYRRGLRPDAWGT